MSIVSCLVGAREEAAGRDRQDVNQFGELVRRYLAISPFLAPPRPPSLTSFLCFSAFLLYALMLYCFTAFPSSFFFLLSSPLLFHTLCSRSALPHTTYMWYVVGHCTKGVVELTYK